MQKPQAVIFDMDGVLVDSPQRWRKHTRGFFEQIGIVPSKEIFAKVMGLSMQKSFELLKSTYKISTSQEEFKQFGAQAAKQIYHQQTQMLTGVSELLQLLQKHQVPMALASSAPQEWVSIVLERFNLHTFFSVVLSAHDVEECKPHPEIFIKAASLLQKSPDNCWVIEDSIAGVEAAKAANMSCLAVLSSLSREDFTKADKITVDFKNINLDFFLE